MSLAEAARIAQIQAWVENELYQMGNEPNAIADYLNTVEAWGDKKEPLTCPISVRLDDVLEHYTNQTYIIWVDERQILIKDESNLLLQMNCPSLTSKFISLFDEGNYPFLEKSTTYSIDNDIEDPDWDLLEDEIGEDRDGY